MDLVEKEGRDYFTNFLAQIGIEDGEQFLAQLSSELSSDEI